MHAGRRKGRAAQLHCNTGIEAVSVHGDRRILKVSSAGGIRRAKHIFLRRVLRKVIAAFKRRGITVKCIQTDNGFEFTNRFSPSKRDKKTLFENTLSQLGIEHKLIRPYTPRHNGKVERSHREDHNKFYSCHRFYSCDDLNVQLAARLSRTNNRPMRPLKWFSPIEFLNNSVQYD